jgi:hypothetical protein
MILRIACVRSGLFQGGEATFMPLKKPVAKSYCYECSYADADEISERLGLRLETCFRHL